MIVVGLYIYVDGVAQRVDLFNDEKISVTSSVQDIADISKVFTDYSQSFTIPASTKNNAIFAHWYENSVANGYDARLRADGYIELDTIPFRRGKIQLEKANLLKGQVDNYTITFFGSLISLKDAFNNRKLKELDFSSIPFSYNGTAVQNKVSGDVNSDVKFPLITSLNRWTYLDNGAQDIHKTNSPVNASDLFPALRVSKIFDIIASNLGITFSGSFLSDLRFTRAFLWLKNGEAFALNAAPVKINFDAKTGVGLPLALFDLPSDTFGYDGGFVDTPNGTVQGDLVLANIKITFTTAGINCKLHVFYEGVQQSVVDLVTTTTQQTINIILTDIGNYSFYVSAASIITFNAEFNYVARGNDPVTFERIENSVQATQTANQTTSLNLDLANYMPDIKAEDFFSGILKMFNLTCYSEQAGVFRIEQLESWYNDGQIRDVTPFIITDTTDIERMTSYKNINFNYEKSENFLSVQYKQNSPTEYGDLVYQLDIDGGDYTIKLPFENLLFQKFTGSTLQVGYALKTDFRPYTPKPIILYDYGTLQACDIHFNNGTTTPRLLTYNMFGQDTLISGLNYTLNWGIEQSSFTDQLEERTLFNQYYENYISNIFNFRARKLKLKARMPISLITNLKLNDRLVIRDKRYTINSFTTDLTTGLVDLELMTDFRTI